MFHKTIHKAWYLCKHLEQLQENSTQDPVLRLLLDWLLFLIDQIGIE